MQYIGDNEIVGKYLGDTAVQKQYLGDNLVWENTPAPVGPADNEIWYTTTDGNPISISGFNITGNTYNNGQGILSFSTTVTSVGREMFLEKSTLRTPAP